MGCGTSYFAASRSHMPSSSLPDWRPSHGRHSNSWLIRRLAWQQQHGRRHLSHRQHAARGAGRRNGAETGRMYRCVFGWNSFALTRASEWVIPSTMGSEPALPKTRSYTSTLMRGYLQAVALARLDGRKESAWEGALHQAPGLTRQVIAACRASQGPGRSMARAGGWLSRRRPAARHRFGRHVEIDRSSLVQRHQLGNGRSSARHLGQHHRR